MPRLNETGEPVDLSLSVLRSVSRIHIEYLRNMAAARLRRDSSVRWVEVCFCATPLAEERPYWEEYFELVRVQDAHGRDRCRDLDGTEPWACCGCDCTDRLEAWLSTRDRPFLDVLRAAAPPQQAGRRA